MIKIVLADFSFQSDILSHYSNVCNVKRSNFNLDHFNKWVSLNYDINDSKNYLLSYRDCIQSSVYSSNVNNNFCNKLVSFIKQVSGLEISDKSSLMGLSFIIRGNKELLDSGACIITLEDIVLNCSLLYGCGIITTELKTLLDILIKKTGVVSISNQQKLEFIQLINTVG